MTMARILVVDDELVVRRAITALLRSGGFEVIAAETGADGLREFDNAEFDVAIIDTFLRGPLSGIDVIKSLRQSRPALPIIAISGRAAPDLHGQNAHFPGVLTLRKPFRAAELFDAVKKATNKA
jgi:CheY-like chemotaxis protein